MESSNYIAPLGCDRADSDVARRVLAAFLTSITIISTGLFPIPTLIIPS